MCLFTSTYKSSVRSYFFEYEQWQSLLKRIKRKGSWKESILKIISRQVPQEQTEINQNFWLPRLTVLFSSCHLRAQTMVQHKRKKNVLSLKPTVQETQLSSVPHLFVS